MKNRVVQSLISILIVLLFCLNIAAFSEIEADRETPLIIDHEDAHSFHKKPIGDSAIIDTKNKLHIAYEHTSHGSQIIDGMTALALFMEGKGGYSGVYFFNSSFLQDNAMESYAPDPSLACDLGYPQWSNATRNYLLAPENADCNVVIWSWCGQVSTKTEQQVIDDYLTPMSNLENEFPNVMFVYMTGHVDGTGIGGNLNLRNEQIRYYCLANNKILYDFADIESYDPEGNYFGDKNVTDNCDWNNGTHSGNWAIDWQNTHIEDVDWYDCSCAHSQALNGNMKAYAAWMLWVRLAGWEIVVTENPLTMSIIIISLLSLVIVAINYKRK